MCYSVAVFYFVCMLSKKSSVCVFVYGMCQQHIQEKWEVVKVMCRRKLMPQSLVCAWGSQFGIDRLGASYLRHIVVSRLFPGEVVCRFGPPYQLECMKEKVQHTQKMNGLYVKRSSQSKELQHM